jgi:hypothetical protein
MLADFSIKQRKGLEIKKKIDAYKQNQQLPMKQYKIDEPEPIQPQADQILKSESKEPSKLDQAFTKAQH